MRKFSTERWLQGVVEDRGNATQRAQFADLLRQLSFLDGVDVEGVLDDEDDGRCGLPRDIRFVDQQPMMEVEVYRGLDDVDFPNMDPSKTEDDDEAEDD